MTVPTRYRRLSLAELINQLDDIGSEPVEGLEGLIHSDRGFYERNATTPTEEISTGTALAAAYRSQVGNTMHGWKGGEYIVSLDQPVYYAERGDCGPAIIGIECGDDGTHRPVLLDDDPWW